MTNLSILSKNSFTYKIPLVLFYSLYIRGIFFKLLFIMNRLSVTELRAMKNIILHGRCVCRKGIRQVSVFSSNPCNY